ncbi:putative branched-chain amino acid transport ATP-binding protein LivG [Metallosphaera sp. J1]|uniref:ABC transporter ATP-binding protein n=1 Tax=Metallosphaera TaxID=41980 RepID=UPI001EDF1DBD|nr:ABC transporter ATP-binding protein [Metallosphaera javensis (ex Hofmann et al. 2022)]MCG3109111.1 putative branched-chain amino acid transport ATP-binding protein LivG [Metallosphaera javensis (ex Hofmann et al. 2022)]
MDCITLTNVVKRFGTTYALNGLSFSIPCGGRYSLLGPNGAGKSTTMKILAGLIRPDSGEALIKGMTPGSKEVKRILAYLPEDPVPYRILTVRENLEYFASLRGIENPREKAEEMIDLFGLREYERIQAGKLSRGNQQKLSLALVLLHDPEIVLLDEPLNYLDIPTQERIINILRGMNSTFLVSTHIMSIASRLTDHVVMISRGRVIWAGSIQELRALGREDEPIESVVSRMMTDDH